MHDQTRGMYPAFSTQAVTLHDVEFAYRLFLARDVETPEIAAERIGQPRIDVIRGLLTSEEFYHLTGDLIVNDHAADGVLAAQPSPQLRAWMVDFLGLDVVESDLLQDAGNWPATLALVFDLDWIRLIADEHFGAGGTVRLVERLRSADARMRAASHARDVAAHDDIANLYWLILDRAPESQTVMDEHSGRSTIDAAVIFLASREFAARLVESVLSGRRREAELLDEKLARWLRGAFHLDFEETIGRHHAIAALLRSPGLRRALNAVEISWDVDLLIERLMQVSLVPGDGDAAPEGSFRALLQASNLLDPDWYLARYPDIRRAGANPLDHFVHHGAFEGRDPGPRFETAFYLSTYPEVASYGLSPIEHYLQIGQLQGAIAKGPRPFERWVARFDRLTDDDRRRIAAAGAANARGAILHIHVANAKDAASIASAMDVSGKQIGADPAYCLVDGDQAVNRATKAIEALADGSIILLSAGRARLREHAAFTFACALSEPDVDVAYSDHDMIDPDGRRSRPVFKPEMSPDLMVRQPYAGSAMALRVGTTDRQHILAALEEARAGSPDHAFARLILAHDRRTVVRVPLPLFSLLDDETPDPLAMLNDAHEPTGLGAHEPPERALATVPTITILIPTRDRTGLLRDCIDSIFAATDYPMDKIRIVVVDNDSREPESLDYFAELAAQPNCEVVPVPGAFNFARICNEGAALATVKTDAIIFLNNDTTVIEPDWLTTLAANVMRPEIGIVGTQLLYPDDTVQHGGVLLGLSGVGGHRLIGLPVEDARERDVTRQMTAVTGACLAIRRALFEQLEGFDTVLGVAFNDVDLCIRAVKAGYQNLYIARPLLYHHESKSRGFDDTRQKLERNAREAIYVRQRHDAFFRDDPSYSPNLSLQRDGEIAFPPRVMRPWRRNPDRRHVLILSVVHGIGHGVGCVVAKQADAFLRRGWTVTVGGAVSKVDRDYPGCRRVSLASAEDAAVFAVEAGLDCVIAHTPPFFSLTRFLGQRPLFYAYDHGEPPPELFPDAEVRRDIDWEKRFCVPLARRVFAISQTIRDAQFRSDAIVLRNGNSHLAAWSKTWAGRRAQLRRKFGFEGRYVILNVCRFHEAERAYKGVDDYITLAQEAPYEVPGLADEAMFVLVGRGDEKDVAYVRKAGLTVMSNVTDAEMAELYAASDLYVNLSRWEGYNLGIGQALAMGLEAIASDIPAHREFGIPVATTQPRLCALVGEAFARREEAATHRAARVEDWDRPMTALIDIVEQDVAEDLAGRWI